MKGNSLFIICILILLSSCRGTKTTIGKSNVSVNDIIKNHNATAPNFTTLAGRVQVVYEDDKKKQTITASVRIEKDKTIWIKASILGITLAKVLITPDGVSYYESISKTYFEGNYSFLSDLLGIEINFNKAQDILLGQSIVPLDSSNYKAELIIDELKLRPKQETNNFMHTVLLNTNNYRLSSESLSQPEDNRILNIRYENYQLIEEQYYPSIIDINALEKGSKTTIGLKFRKIDLNVNVSFPFKVPNGYKEIQLK